MDLGEIELFPTHPEGVTILQRAQWWRLPYHDGGSLEHFEFRPTFRSLRNV